MYYQDWSIFDIEIIIIVKRRFDEITKIYNSKNE